MKITFIGHASILVETRGLSVLSDPWWGSPCFGAQWWNYPSAAAHLAEGRKLDYIYISHGHHDHLHPGTLGRLDRGARVLIAAGTDLAPSIQAAGFQVIEVEPAATCDLGNGVHCRISPTCNDDSLMIISDGEEVCVNLNDALHAAPPAVQATFVERIRAWYPKLDYVFCGFGVASHFPNCYRIPGKDRERTAQKRQQYFNSQWAVLMAALQPRFAFPFAADVVLLEDDLFWANVATHNGQRPVDALRQVAPQFPGTALDIAPGFQIVDGRVAQPNLHQQLDPQQLRAELAQGVTRANSYPGTDAAAAEAVLQLLRANLEKCRPYLAGYPEDYRILIRFRGAPQGIIIEKRATELRAELVDDSAAAGNCNLTFTTRLPYLRMSLSTQYGNETLFVGSGCLLDYPSREQARRNLQRELSVMLRRQEHALTPRPKSPNRLIVAAKRAIKRLLGRREVDLYDVVTWTVWERG
jgi:Beta-lactamase superfamily domain